MKTQSCRAMIESRSASLTKAETAVADYVLKNMDKVLDYTVTELAEKAGSSEASVVRFCKSVGFKGYQDFKVSAAMDIIPPARHMNPALELSDDASSITQKIFDAGVEVLNDTLLIQSTRDLEKAAQKMAKARSITFFGTGGSILVALDARHKLLKIGVDATVEQDADHQAMTASLLHKGDVAIGISHSGSNQRVMHCMRLAKENGAFTIGMTTQGKSPLSKLSDLMLYTATRETVFKSESVSARIAQLVVLDALVAIIALANHERSYDAIQKTRNATSGGKY